MTTIGRISNHTNTALYTKPRFVSRIERGVTQWSYEETVEVYRQVNEHEVIYDAAVLRRYVNALHTIDIPCLCRILSEESD